MTEGNRSNGSGITVKKGRGGDLIEWGKKKSLHFFETRPRFVGTKTEKRARRPKEKFLRKAYSASKQGARATSKAAQNQSARPSSKMRADGDGQKAPVAWGEENVWRAMTTGLAVWLGSEVF